MAWLYSAGEEGIRKSSQKILELRRRRKEKNKDRILPALPKRMGENVTTKREFRILGKSIGVIRRV